MRIGELATRAGVSVRALRYYEEQHLLFSVRSPSGQRLYPEHAIQRVNLIQQLYAAGIASRTILKLLPCVEAADPVTMPHSHELLFRERERIDAQITTLVQTRNTLDAVIDAAQACTALPGNSTANSYPAAAPAT